MSARKKYRVWVVVKNRNPLTYNVTNFVSFTAFLDRAFPNWSFYNVYPYIKGQITTEKITSFTKNRKPQKPFL